MCLAGLELDTLGSGVKAAFVLGCTVWCAWCLSQPMCECVFLMHGPTGTVPRRPHPHILMRLALSVTLPSYTQSQLVVKKQVVASLCLLYISLLPHPLTPHTHTHPHTYLFIILMHTYTYSKDSPQDSWLQLDYFVFMWESLSTLYFSLHFSHMNTK